MIVRDRGERNYVRPVKIPAEYVRDHPVRLISAFAKAPSSRTAFHYPARGESEESAVLIDVFLARTQP